MPNAHGRSIDTTCLTADREVEKGVMHRDFFAHVLRWQYVVRYLKKGHDFSRMRTLDVGCGHQAPLPRFLQANHLAHGDGPGQYVGVDYSKTITPSPYLASAITRGKWHATFVPGCDFAHEERAAFAGKFDLITCFEMLEHVEPAHTFATLRKIRNRLAKDGEAILSTPCFDPRVGAADNHVNEMTYAGLRFVLGVIGLEVVDVWGTFASKRDYKAKLAVMGLTDVAYARLEDYFFPEVLAVMMGPLVPPDAARNCVWRVRWAEPRHYLPRTPPVDAAADPANSSAVTWEQDLRALITERQHGKKT